MTLLALKGRNVALEVDVRESGMFPTRRDTGLFHIGIAAGDEFVVSEHCVGQVWTGWMYSELARSLELSGPNYKPSRYWSLDQLDRAAASAAMPTDGLQPQAMTSTCHLVAWPAPATGGFTSKEALQTSAHDGSYTPCSDDSFVDERNHLLNDNNTGEAQLPGHHEDTDLTSPARDEAHWEEVQHFASQHSDTVVLCAGGYRFARPEKNELATAMRAKLLYCVASGALRSISSVGLGAAAEFSTVGAAWVELIQTFRVEDEESLDYLLQACATELGALPDGAGASLAKAYLPKALRRGWTSGMDLLARHAGVEPDKHAIQSSLPHALRLGNLGWREEPTAPFSATCRV